MENKNNTFLKEFLQDPQALYIPYCVTLGTCHPQLHFPTLLSGLLLTTICYLRLYARPGKDRIY